MVGYEVTPSKISFCAALALFSGSMICLIGWMLGAPLLTSYVPSPVGMNPLTAILFLVASSAFLLGDPTHPAKWRWARCLGTGITVCSIAVFVGLLNSWDAGIDRWLFYQSLGSNRMAPNTALNFALVGLAITTLNYRWYGFRIHEILTLVVLSSALISVIGYAYGTKSLYGLGNYIPMAFSSAVLFMLCGISLLCAGGKGGILGLFSGKASGTFMVRRMLPIAIIVPCILGYLRIVGQRAGWFDTEFGAALMVVTTVIMLAVAIVYTAGILNAADEIRVRDAAALQRAHQESQWQSTLLQSILNSMGEGVVVANQHGEFVQFNPAANRILGRGATSSGPESWTGHFGLHLADGTPYPTARLPLTRAINGEAVTEEELFVRNQAVPDGRWISIAGSPLITTSCGCSGGVIVFRDVTERKRMESKLREAHESLERRVEARTKELSDANRELAQKNQENEMFVYSVSHDLRSPLVNLQGFAKELGMVSKDLTSLLSADEVPGAIRQQAAALLDGDMQQSLRFIQLAVTRLGGIIDALLRLSRVGRVEYRLRRVDCDTVVQNVFAAMSATLSDSNVQVAAAPLPSCYGDETAIEQLFANLVCNAVKYRDPSRPCKIEVGVADKSTSGMVTYFVKDNGLGIPAAHQEKIFQAFKRAHPQVAAGEGMGLAIVRRTVERHGGTAWVESEEGKGSTFFVSLPMGPGSRPAKTESSDLHTGEREHGSRTNDDLVGGRR